MDVAEFHELRPLFPPMLHTVCPAILARVLVLGPQVCLVYSTSEYYNSPMRIIVLMKVLSCHLIPPICHLQEICNLLIEQSQKFLDPSTIFQIEVRDFLVSLQVSPRARLKRRWTK
jgi:hypothetical protein